ncbi:aldehyde dehydrogenase (NAD+) [Rhodovulum imhoffii]|uniref:Aldehyde dehydrogenase (NAD+) n=1 Tax=Rhodovulum imhoffii TaxID=365340 RepID=A0A2T5BST2_9RHOB|nr:aldehyde dehydrogenase family protein [Rhodovulum imhoffii]MBK5934371.1 aldehyde dehydrogenase [Rhodovulum imhoffii]PTN02434.1 aldehyde dehydrogenase (NAD+) [Rhodovulum imhoffii]
MAERNLPETSALMESMAYGPAPESPSPALDWIAEHGRFGCFVAGAFEEPGATFETRNPATGEVLAHVTQADADTVARAVAAARAALPGWAGATGHARARLLYAIARLVQKQAKLLAVLETLDTGKPIRESRDIDVPLAVRHFYYHAGLAQLWPEELPGHSPIGVCGQIVPWNFPLLMLAWKVAPALAAGNTVVLKPAEYTPLSALMFAQLCQQAGVPAGVVNIVTGDGDVGERIVAHDGIDKIAFTGSTEVGRRIRKITAGRGKALTLELGGKSPYLVFEDADLDSAVEGLVDSIWLNQGQVCCAGARLLVQEGIAASFYDKLKTRMRHLRLGDPLDKCTDVGAIVDPAQLARVTGMVAQGGGDVFQPCQAPGTGCFYPPTLITGLSPADRLMQEEIFGPVLVATTFRTPAEAVALANDTRYGLAASIWSETLPLALEVAPKLAAGVVWVNGANMFDAAVGFGGLRESGFGREGGWEGLTEYLRAPGGRPEAVPVTPGVVGPAPLDRTAKMFIGGRQTRPDSGESLLVRASGGQLLGHVGAGNRKDIRNAVEAARKAQPAWAGLSGHARAQVLYYIAENLSARSEEFTERLAAQTGAGDAGQQVARSLEALFACAAWSDKYDGRIKDVPMRGVALGFNVPVGVVGVLCPSVPALEGAITAMGAAIAMGNTCVLVAPETAPLSLTDFYQVLETSDLPGGVANIVTGRTVLAETLAGHLDVDAVWAFAPELGQAVEAASCGNLKRTWITPWPGRDLGPFLRAATEVRTVWIPWGA